MTLERAIHAACQSNAERRTECQKCPAKIKTDYGVGTQACRLIAEDQARAIIEAIMEPDDSVLQAMHDGPLMADEHHMDDKTRAWLLDLWQTGMRALLAEMGERGDDT